LVNANPGLAPDTDPRIFRKLNNFTVEKNSFFSKIALYLSLGPHEGRPIYLKEHTTLQNNTFLHFFSFLGHFCPPSSGFGSNQPKSMEIHADPDTQHCFFLYLIV
jgi:hypothetical protein